MRRRQIALKLAALACIAWLLVGAVLQTTGFRSSHLAVQPETLVMVDNTVDTAVLGAQNNHNNRHNNKHHQNGHSPDAVEAIISDIEKNDDNRQRPAPGLVVDDINTNNGSKRHAAQKRNRSILEERSRRNSFALNNDGAAAARNNIDVNSNINNDNNRQIPDDTNNNNNNQNNIVMIYNNNDNNNINNNNNNNPPLGQNVFNNIPVPPSPKNGHYNNFGNFGNNGVDDINAQIQANEQRWRRMEEERRYMDAKRGELINQGSMQQLAEQQEIERRLARAQLDFLHQQERDMEQARLQLMQQRLQQQQQFDRPMAQQGQVPPPPFDNQPHFGKQQQFQEQLLVRRDQQPQQFQLNQNQNQNAPQGDDSAMGGQQRAQANAYAQARANHDEQVKQQQMAQGVAPGGKRVKRMRFVGIRGERHSGTNWLRLMLNLNCRNLGNGDDLFGWKHDFLRDWSNNTDLIIFVSRDARTWLPALAGDTFEARYYIPAAFPFKNPSPDPNLTVKTIMSEAFPAGISGGPDFDNAVDMRNKKYRNWHQLSQNYNNVVSVRYEDLVRDALPLFKVLVEKHGFECETDPRRFRKVSWEVTRATGGGRKRPKSVYSQKEIHWTQEEWMLLRNKLDMDLEQTLGYSYPENGWMSA